MPLAGGLDGLGAGPVVFRPVLGARILLLAAVAVWGSTFVASRICLAYLDPLDLVGLRFAIGVPLLAAWLVVRRPSLDFGGRDLPRLALAASIITVHFLLQAVALQYTTASRTSWIIAVAPLIIAFLAARWLGEAGSRRLWGGIALATIGLVLLITDGDLGALDGIRSLGDGLVLLSAFTWAFYTLATRDLSRSRDPLLVTALVTLPLSLLGFGLALDPSRLALWSALPGRTLIALGFLGLAGTLAQWFWQIGIARIGAARAGVFLYIEPIVTLALAIPLLGETLGLVALVGGILVLVGVGWAERA